MVVSHRDGMKSGRALMSTCLPVHLATFATLLRSNHSSEPTSVPCQAMPKISLNDSKTRNTIGAFVAVVSIHIIARHRTHSNRVTIFTVTHGKCSQERFQYTTRPPALCKEAPFHLEPGSYGDRKSTRLNS